jgi:large subunit ribosomal protein L23
MNILIKPIITEKSMRDAAAGRFTFAVAKTANKRTIASQVSEQFGVSVVKVTTNLVKGRRGRVGKRRQRVSLPPWKKAVVQLKKGETIALFDVQGGTPNA